MKHALAAFALFATSLPAVGDQCAPFAGARVRNAAQLQELSRITDAQLRARAAAHLALGLARGGERDGALEAARVALEPADLPKAVLFEVHLTLAPAMARLHGAAVAREHLAAALVVASSPSERGVVLANLARFGSDAQAASDALRALQELPASGGTRNEQLARLAALEVLVQASASFPIEARLRAAFEDADRASEAMLAADALALLGTARARAGDPASARQAFDRAVALAAAADSPRLHDLLWQRARLASGRRADEETLDDYARAIDSLRRVRGDVESELADFGATFRSRYGELYIEYADRLLRRAETAPEAERRSLLLHAREAVETAKVAEVAEYFRDPCIARDAVRARLEVADPSSAVLYYIAFKDRVVALVSHARGIEQVRLAANEAELSAMVESFRRLVEKRTTRQYLKPAQRLYAALIAPLEDRLAAIAPKTLVVVPDGALRTIPFATLHDGRRFLVQRFAVAVAPGLSLTDPRPLAQVRPAALIHGLTQARHGFPSLPAVEDEVSALRLILDARVSMNEAFVMQRMLEDVERNPSGIVHIASHGQFSTSVEETFILTYDGKLGIDALRRAIAAGKARPEPIEILTLSACQTALGDERAALGLAGVAVRAGARSALASLWFVNDESTAMLVTSFYRNAVARRMPRAEALRAAQLEMIGDSRFDHPAYWGAFLLIGSWL